MSHIQLNYAFLFVWNFFGEIHWKVLFLVKNWLYQKESQNYSESLFRSTILKITKSRGKFGFCINNCFDQTSKKGQISTKTVFLLKMCHLELNYVFWLFWSIFWLNPWKLLFLVKKVISQKKLRNTKKFVFLNRFEKLKSLGKFQFDVNNYVFQTREMRQIEEKNVCLFNISHIEQNSAFLLLWSIFSEIHWKLLFLVKKWLSQKESQKYSKKNFFKQFWKV